ncbi:hypothetical protein C8Q75DRAFT_732212 [Abortiporus biennis]|nr:hypothetical protein C8Q75DRAFT_732212 [Abortiporus biennis]
MKLRMAVSSTMFLFAVVCARDDMDNFLAEVQLIDGKASNVAPPELDIFPGQSLIPTSEMETSSMPTTLEVLLVLRQHASNKPLQYKERLTELPQTFFKFTKWPFSSLSGFNDMFVG